MHYHRFHDSRRFLPLGIITYCHLRTFTIANHFHFRRKEDTEVAVERRYQGEYENRLDPFQSFSQSERKRKYGQLSVAEKVKIKIL